MKFFKILSVLSIILILNYSCRKEEMKNSNDVIISEVKVMYSNLKSINSDDNAKIAYSMLSDRERYGIWLTKFTEEIGRTNYNEKQIERIQIIKDYLSIEIFKEGDAREIFYTQWFPEWVVESSKVFNSMEIANLVFSLNPIELKSKTIEGDVVTRVEEAPRACICALNSNFTCPNYTVSWPPSVTYGTCTKTRSCVQSTNGCGALWDQECDGDHCDKTVEEV